VASIRLETVIEAPAAACFDLSASVDAHTASMSGSRERAVDRLVLARYLARLIRQRNVWLKQALEGSNEGRSRNPGRCR
jgi:hypothetical protein